MPGQEFYTHMVRRKVLVKEFELLIGMVELVLEGG